MKEAKCAPFSNKVLHFLDQTFLLHTIRILPWKIADDFATIFSFYRIPIFRERNWVREWGWLQFCYNRQILFVCSDSIRGQCLVPLGRVPKNSKMKKLFSELKRSRQVHNPRYQELYSAPKNKKVVMISMWEKNYRFWYGFFSGWYNGARIVANLILGLTCAPSWSKRNGPRGFADSPLGQKLRLRWK